MPRRQKIDYVERILEKRVVSEEGRKPKTWYLVLWSGYPQPRDFTWEPIESFCNPVVVQNFEKQLLAGTVPPPPCNRDDFPPLPTKIITRKRVPLVHNAQTSASAKSQQQQEKRSQTRSRSRVQRRSQEPTILEASAQNASTLKQPTAEAAVGTSISQQLVSDPMQNVARSVSPVHVNPPPLRTIRREAEIMGDYVATLFASAAEDRRKFLRSEVFTLLMEYDR